jgi:hypothetical protein
MILAQRPAAMAGVAAIAQSPAFTGLAAYLQPLGLPQPMNTLDVHTPAVLAKQNTDPTVAVPRPPDRQFMHRVNEGSLIFRNLSAVTLARPCLANSPADSTLRITQPVTKVLDSPPPADRAYKFFEL